MIDPFELLKLNEDEVCRVAKSFLREKGLINRECPHCTSPDIQIISLCSKTGTSHFRCRTCITESTDRTRTFFAQSKIPYSQWLIGCLYFCEGFTTSQTLRLMHRNFPQRKISLAAVRTVFDGLERALHPFALDEMKSLFLSGPVELDETLLYKLKRGYRGRLIKTKIWLFGIKCRKTKKFVLYPMARRNRFRVMSIIQKHVREMSVIYTDCFSIYVNNRTRPKTSFLKGLNYVHLWVDHSRGFISELTSIVHTNTVERSWRSVKTFMRRENPRKKIALKISKYLFFDNYTVDERMNLLVHIIALIRQEKQFS
jgi:transposase-like protein